MIRVAKKENETEFEWLVGVLAQNFGTIDKRFNTIDERFDAIDERFDSVDSRLDTIDTKVHTLEGEIKGTNSRLDDYIIPLLDDHARRVKDLELILA